jgi:rhodanese-related sulfurtransferase
MCLTPSSHRNQDLFQKCRIKTAVNYPAAWIRADRITKELFTYKTKKDSFIVIYDECEREAPLLATTLIEKGFDNVLVLHGGLANFINCITAFRLVEGDFTTINTLAAVPSSKTLGGSSSSLSISLSQGRKDRPISSNASVTSTATTSSHIVASSKSRKMV